MGFLEKEADGKSAFWDWVFGIGLLVLVGGFTAYYQYQKRLSRERFQAADTLYQTGEYAAAARAYEVLKDASYLTTSDDSTLYARLEHIEDLQEREKEAVARLRVRLAAGDTEGARADLDTATFRGLLSGSDQRWLDSVRSVFGE
jgi:hypothetical protein